MIAVSTNKNMSYQKPNQELFQSCQVCCVYKDYSIKNILWWGRMV